MRFDNQTAFEPDNRSGVRPKIVQELAKVFFGPPKELLVKEE